MSGCIILTNLLGDLNANICEMSRISPTSEQLA